MLLLYLRHLSAVVGLQSLYSSLQDFDGFTVRGYLPMQGGVLPLQRIYSFRPFIILSKIAYGLSPPEQFADFLLGHGGCTYIGQQGDITLPVHRDDVSFFFHRYTVLRRLNGPTDVLFYLL